jgi:hypothetical protein
VCIAHARTVFAFQVLRGRPRGARAHARARADACRATAPGTPLDVFVFASPDASWRSAEALLRERGADAHLLTARALRHARCACFCA